MSNFVDFLLKLTNYQVWGLGKTALAGQGHGLLNWLGKDKLEAAFQDVLLVF